MTITSLLTTISILIIIFLAIKRVNAKKNENFEKRSN